MAQRRYARLHCGTGAERGMVTVELAMGTLAVIGLLVTVCWVIFVVVCDLRISDTAAALARQAARGDAAGMAVVRSKAPRDAQIRLTNTDELSIVDVDLRARPFGWAAAGVALHVEATAVREPGQNE